MPRLGAIKLLVICLLFGSMASLGMLGASAGLENAIRTLGFAINGKPASGQLLIVEMDAASVAAAQRWPWPRSHYANVVERLNAAEVRSINFDVDFSSPSDAAEDARFASALASADSLVVLPTFAQLAAYDARNQIDALPLAALREHASLASVSVLPDSDGLVRNMPLGTVTAGTARPSLSAHIANRSGSAGATFPIDFSIDPNTIPRHSFVAIERGYFDATQLRGKDIIIGATAVEMGDRHVVPRLGVLPGVVVQALAAETLFLGVPVDAGWVAPLVLAGLMSLWIMSAATISRTFLGGSIALSAILLGTWVAWSGALLALEIVPALGVVVGAIVFQFLFLIRQQNRAKRMIDAETGLPNQHALGEAQAQHKSGFTIAAMIGDFDALKAVLGEEQIGQLVVRLTERLNFAAQGGVIYRIDQRVLAWTSELTHYELENCLSGLNAIMRSPIEVGGRRVDVTLGIGIAENGSPLEASHVARLALQSGDKWRYHQASERMAVESQLSLMGELDAAIAGNELAVVYQPKLNIASSTVTAVEALVRWQHPEHGLLNADAFIPLAEETGRIANMTIYVLKRTIADLQKWNAQGVTLNAAVNISARLVSSDNFISSAIDILGTMDLSPGQLTFEVTESARLEDQSAAVAALRRFRDLGVAISMDDYGTGQSTLNYLKTLPLSELKIDRSFVQFAHREQNDALLVRSTVNLAHQLGLRVVAEGVENVECLDFLRTIGCDYAQGYYISRALNAERLVEFVQVRVPLPDMSVDAV